MASEYRKQLEEWLKKLDVKATRVLDIGGEQLPVNKRVKSWDVKHYEILDLPDFDLDKPGSFSNYEKTGDIIFCLEVFEYLINPLNAMRSIAWCMKPTGKAYITFPFVYPHHNELEFDSLRYTEPGVRRLAHFAGLQVANVWYRTDTSGLLFTMYQANRMKMAKEYQKHNAVGFIVEVTK